MYAYIKGRITDMSESAAIIETGGVGYEVAVSAYTLSRISVGNDTVLYTYMSVSENGIGLYGFCTKEERALFLKLINISGIGPKGAVAILGGMSPADLGAAIASGNAAALSSIKGVGKKTAERIIMELKDKMVAGYPAAPAAAQTVLEGEAKEAAEVLVALGYKPDEAERAVIAAYESGMTVNRIVHKAIGGK